MERIALVTGGAGFIGSHLADELLAAGYRVRVLDCLHPQVHGDPPTRPPYLSDAVELMEGDIRDPEAVAAAVDGVSAVFHLAARVGVGQSMYELTPYVDANVHGTAVLLEQLIGRRIERLVVASSMSVYGEGLYRDRSGAAVERERGADQVREGRWDVQTDQGEPLEPVPTPEWKRPALASIYAQTKMDQEQMCLMTGRAYGIPTVALRFFNVYGPRQALSNPYTGVLAIFGSRLLNGRPPLIFEDGHQRRDFVHVSDAVRACRAALEAPGAIGQVVNVGSGDSISILELAQAMCEVMETDVAPVVTGKYRTGDIRHCFADVTRARETLGFQPQVELGEGLRELTAWLVNQPAEDRVEEASEQLTSRGLAL